MQKREKEREGPPDARGEDVAVLFSGGVDSTTVAVLAAERFKRVHLLTFNTGFLYNVDLSRKHVVTLKELFGDDAIRHELIDIRRVWRAVQRTNVTTDLRRYRSWFILCMGCKLTMHAATIRYCREHGIHHAYGGENVCQDQYPEQKQAILDELQHLYQDYSITYESPVYDYTSMEEDTKLQALGFQLGHHLKLFPNTKGSYHGTQPFCLSFPLYPFANTFPPKDTPVVEYLREHLPWARAFIEDGHPGDD